MTDILIRDVPENVIASIDAKATKLGISRTEYLRRSLVREGTESSEEVTVSHFAKFATAFADLLDDDVMADAWR